MNKTRRVRKNEEFSKIIGKRHIFSSASFIIYINEKVENNARIGISVSKKIGIAVLRNKIKRQLRMMFMDLIDFDNYPYDLICIVKKSYVENSFETNKLQLEKLIKKAIINK